MKLDRIKKEKPFIVTLAVLGGLIILLASFISIPSADTTTNEVLSRKFDNLSLKDSLMLSIKESHLHRREAEKVIAQYDQDTDYQYFHRSHSIREMLWEEKELLRSTLDTWQQSATWESDSLTIVNNLAKQRSLSSQIEGAIKKLN